MTIIIIITTRVLLYAEAPGPGPGPASAWGLASAVVFVVKHGQQIQIVFYILL